MAVDTTTIERDVASTGVVLKECSKKLHKQLKLELPTCTSRDVYVLSEPTRRPLCLSLGPELDTQL